MRGDPVIMEAEMGVMWPQVKECQQEKKLEEVRNGVPKGSNTLILAL